MSLPRQIAVFLPNWVGDVVMAGPALRALRRRFAAARIAHVGRPVALETLAGTGWADYAIPERWPEKPRARHFLAAVEQLRAGRFELGVLLPNSFRVALLARLAGIKRIAGYDRDGRGWMLTEKLAAPRDERGRFRPIPTIDYYLELLQMLGVECDSRRLELAVTSAGEADAEALLDAAGVDRARPVVMLNPGASFGASKIWHPGRFAAVADALIERQDVQIIINAAPSERRTAAKVGEAMRRRPAINFADRSNTISLLKSLLRRCVLLITNDTGARHFAAAFGIGVVSLFGSTDPRWAQIDYEHERIVRVDVPCSPCQRKVCPKPPGRAYHQCMEAITPEMVLAPAQELLARFAAGATTP